MSRRKKRKKGEDPDEGRIREESEPESESESEPESEDEDEDEDEGESQGFDQLPSTALHRVQETSQAEEQEERPSAWQRHDLLVLIGALALLAAGVLAYRSLTTPELERFSRFGLSLERPSAWLPPRPVPPSPARLAIAVAGEDTSPERRTETASEGLPYHVMFQSPIESLTRLEIRIARRPTFRNLRGALSLARVNRYGEVYWASESGRETIDGRDWMRTRFRYAYKTHTGDSPKVSSGVEYATLNGDLVYVVTFHGTEPEAERLRSLVSPTLSVNANHPAATGRSEEAE